MPSQHDDNAAFGSGCVCAGHFPAALPGPPRPDRCCDLLPDPPLRHVRHKNVPGE